MTHFHYKENQLFCEETPVREIAEEFGTPLYIYSRQQLIENFRSIDGAFAGVDHTTCYALKANSNPELLKLLVKEGAGADAVGACPARASCDCGEGAAARCGGAGCVGLGGEVAGVDGDDTVALDEVARLGVGQVLLG